MRSARAPLLSRPRVAAALARVVAESPPLDVVLLGGRSADGDNALTPFWLAERLGWPCVTEVAGLSPLPGRGLRVESRTDDGSLTEELRTPLVISVGNAPSTYLRVPTLKDKMSHGKKDIDLWGLEDLAKSLPTQAAYELKDLSYEEPKRETVIIEGRDAAEKAGRLFDLYLKKRMQA